MIDFLTSDNIFFNEIKKKKYYKAIDAVYMIKNMDLSMYYIPFDKNNYQTPCDEAL